jgi:hypothetical protein
MTIQQSIMHAIAPFRVRGLCDEHQNHTFTTSTCFLEPISQHPIDHTYETGLLLRSCVLEETKASDIRHGERSCRETAPRRALKIEASWGCPA